MRKRSEKSLLFMLSKKLFCVIILKMNISKIKRIIYYIIFFGIVIRVMGIDIFPAGLNCDEASAAYDSYSILTTMRDRNNVFLPVYLLAWGSGQSALLAYLMMPFIRLLGLNIISTRLPMAIISSMSLIVFYKILNISVSYSNKKNDFFIVFGVLFFALNPWHIMKSRWGLDCNIFPDLVIFGIYFLIKYFINDKNDLKNIVLAFVFFAISAYSYASSYLFLSIFSLFVLFYGFSKRKISIKLAIIIVVTVLLITWPLILFVVVNFFDLKSIELVFLTIPKLRSNRMFNESILSESNVFVALVKNLIDSIKLYIFQYDGLYWNGIKGIGMYYLFSSPFLILGIVDYIKQHILSKEKNENFVDKIFLIWLASGFIANLFHVDININRGNIIIIPIIYFIIKGFGKIFNNKVSRLTSVALLLIGFICFSYLYIDGNIKKTKGELIDGINKGKIESFALGMEQVIAYADSLDSKEIIFDTNIRESYIYVLYYLHVNPQLFYKTKELYNENMTFKSVKSFGKWNFYKPYGIIKDKKYVYIFKKSLIQSIDKNDFSIKEINDYIVVQYKK